MDRQRYYDMMARIQEGMEESGQTFKQMENKRGIKERGLCEGPTTAHFIWAKYSLIIFIFAESSCTQLESRTHAPMTRAALDTFSPGTLSTKKEPDTPRSQHPHHHSHQHSAVFYLY